MRSHSGRLKVALAALAVVAMSTAAPAAATADGPVPDPLGSVLDDTTAVVDDTVGRLGDTLAGGTSDLVPDAAPDATPEAPGPKASAPAPTSDDDSTGHETTDPAAPDHGGATVVDGGVAGQSLATVGRNTGTVEDDDTTTADSTLLAIGGQEVLGAHADSTGTQESHVGDPLAPVCETSSGQVCLRVLYADAYATDAGGTSSATSRSGIADVCLGGTDADPAADCTGPVSTGVATSEGEAGRDQTSGRTTAASESDVADVCLQPDPVTGGCLLGAGAVHSEGGSDSGGADATARRDSYLLALDVGGAEQGRVGDPTALSLPPDCPAGTSLLCVFLNQGESYVARSVAGHAQEALHVAVLPGNLDLALELGRTESLVHNDGGEPVAAPDPTDGRDAPGGIAGTSAGGPGRPGVVAGVGAGVLPQTGGVWSGLLAGGFAAIGCGALLLARSRRLGAASA